MASLAIAALFLQPWQRPQEPSEAPPLSQQPPASLGLAAPEPAEQATEAERREATEKSPLPPGAAPAAQPTPGQGTGEILGQEPSPGCPELGLALTQFFTSLDSKPYIQAMALQDSCQQHFITLADKLLTNPPVVSRETDDLFTLLTNMAHFFRIIGKDNILLIKSILHRERDLIEDIGLELYAWLLKERCRDPQFPLQASLEQLYEYAGFFLNTMGGRSYLFRRDSRSRLLVSYYAILIVDRANQAGLNRHGINLVEPLPLLVNEIEATNQLIYKEQYLDRLYLLLESYQ